MVTTIDGIKTFEEAVQVANEIERLESAVKLLKDELRTYVREHGEVDTGEKVWKFQQVESWNIPPGNLKEIARLIALDGRNPWEYLNITPAKLRSLDWSDETLAGFGEKRIRNNFRGFASRK